jgi:tetratricopeptide (TPR) repeat protein
MEKSPAELLGELDDHDRRRRNRRLLFTALPIGVIFVVYAVMASAVVRRSADLDAKSRELDARRAELVKTESDLAKRKQELATAASDLGVLRGQYDELQKQNDEARKRNLALQATIDQPGNAASKVEKIEELLTGSNTGPKPNARSEAMSLWKQGYDAYNAGNKAQARALYEQALVKDPTYAAALNSLGRLAYDEGNLPLADEYFVKALASSPAYVAAIHNRALVAKKQGRVDDAQNLTNQALKLRPGYQPSAILQSDLDADVRQQMKK